MKHKQERDAAIGESIGLRAIIQTLQRHRFGQLPVLTTAPGGASTTAGIALSIWR